MIKKNQLIETIESFPEEFTLEELVDKLILLDKIEKGNSDSIEDNTLSEVELEEEMKKMVQIRWTHQSVKEHIPRV